MEIEVHCDCGAVTKIRRGRIIKCSKCGRRPKLLWDGRPWAQSYVFAQVLQAKHICDVCGKTKRYCSKIRKGSTSYCNHCKTFTTHSVLVVEEK